MQASPGLPDMNSGCTLGMVCGERRVDIGYLRANTKYRGVSPSDAHVQMLWRVLESFSDDQRQQFLRFVWGQSRLPHNPADFTQKFEILPYHNSSPGALPISHTCFFSIELPRYRTEKQMRDRLLYAIQNCVSVDADHVVDQNDAWNHE